MMSRDELDSEVELLKKECVFQLKTEDMDWVYFFDTVNTLRVNVKKLREMNEV